MQVWSRRAIIPEHRGIGFGAKQAKQPSGSHPQQMSCAYAERQGNEMAPPVILHPEKQCQLSQMHSKKNKQSFLVYCRWSSDHTICPRIACLSSLQEEGSTPRALSQSSHELFWATGCKMHENKPLSFSQLIALGKCFPCPYPCVFHSFLPFSTSGLPPLHNTKIPFPWNHVSVLPTFLNVASSLPLV